MTRYRLIIDERERNLFETLKLEMASAKSANKEIDYEIKTLTVGDYAIVENRTETLIAIFERKTLEKDFPASIRDGRYKNKDKMIAAREKTGCRLYYLVEGDLNPDQNKKYSNYPYKVIESAMIHLEMRDGFHMIRTTDKIDTIRRLMRFIYSLESVDPVLIVKSAITDDISSLKIIEEQSNPTQDLNSSDANQTLSTTKSANENQQIKTGGAESVLTEKHEKSNIDILREMWACFKGISIASADMFLTKYTLKQIVRGEIPRDTINSLKTPTGREISRNVKAALNIVDNVVCEHMLAKVPGISGATAKELIKAAGSLSALLSYEVAAISIMKIGAKQRNLGEKRAKKIVELFCGLAADQTTKLVY